MAIVNWTRASTGEVDPSVQLLSAAKDGDMEALIDAIEARHADINSQDALGQTALHIAAYHGYLEAVEYLVLRGIDTDIKSGDGLTAYNLAVVEDQKECASLIRKRARDVKIIRKKHRRISQDQEIDKLMSASLRRAESEAKKKADAKELLDKKKAAAETRRKVLSSKQDEARHRAEALLKRAGSSALAWKKATFGERADEIQTSMVFSDGKSMREQRIGRIVRRAVEAFADGIGGITKLRDNQERIARGEAIPGLTAPLAAKLGKLLRRHIDTKTLARLAALPGPSASGDIVGEGEDPAASFRRSPRLEPAAAAATPASPLIHPARSGAGAAAMPRGARDRDDRDDDDDAGDDGSPTARTIARGAPPVASGRARAADAATTGRGAATAASADGDATLMGASSILRRVRTAAAEELARSEAASAGVAKGPSGSRGAAGVSTRRGGPSSDSKDADQDDDVGGGRGAGNYDDHDDYDDGDDELRSAAPRTSPAATPVVRPARLPGLGDSSSSTAAASSSTFGAGSPRPGRHLVSTSTAAASPSAPDVVPASATPGGLASRRVVQPAIVSGSSSTVGAPARPPPAASPRPLTPPEHPVLRQLFDAHQSSSDDGRLPSDVPSAEAVEAARREVELGKLTGHEQALLDAGHLTREELGARRVEVLNRMWRAAFEAVHPGIIATVTTAVFGGAAEAARLGADVVSLWLGALQLSRYSEPLVAAGFDTMERLLLLEPEDLRMLFIVGLQDGGDDPVAATPDAESEARRQNKKKRPRPRMPPAHYKQLIAAIKELRVFMDHTDLHTMSLVEAAATNQRVFQFIRKIKARVLARRKAAEATAAVAAAGGPDRIADALPVPQAASLADEV